MRKYRSLMVMVALFACGISRAAVTWEPYTGALPTGVGGPAFISEPVEPGNPFLDLVCAKLYEVPWAPGEAILLRPRASAHGLEAFGFWHSDSEYQLAVRSNGGWRLIVPGRASEPLAQPQLAFFGTGVSGRPVDWSGPVHILASGDGAEDAVLVRTVELWEPGCIEMVLQRGERELDQARDFLSYARKPCPEQQAAVDAAQGAIDATRAELARRTLGLLDTYMSLPEPAYALENLAFFSRLYNRRDRFKEIGYPDAWETMFYGRPEFEPCRQARIAAQDAVWAQRRETLATEARELYGDGAGFALNITHGLVKYRRDRPLAETLKLSYTATMARGEHEPFQVVIGGMGQPIQNAQVSVDWEGTGPHPEVTLRPVGYVETKPDPDNYAEYVGWWPDPLMPSGSVDVAEWETQPVWGTLRATARTSPGRHEATVTVSAEGMEPLQCSLSVDVLDFDLGLTHLPSLLSLRLQSIKSFYKLDDVPQDIRRRWYAFCLEYRMNPNNIYSRDWIPAEEDLDFCIERGFNAMVMTTGNLRTTTRNSTANLQIWTSEDNATYTAIPAGWSLSHSPDGDIVIDGLDLTARYVKVHSLIEDDKYEFSFKTLESGNITALDGEAEHTGPVGWVSPDDGSKPLRSFGANWGAALDYQRTSLGVDLGQSRHVTGLVLHSAMNSTLERAKEFYEVAQRHGVGDKAYIYGFDEWRHVEQYGDIKATYDLLKSVAPGIKASSTVVYPVDPIKETIDAWCPALCYDYPGYKQARQRGQEVWYYAGGAPYDPFPTHELLDVPAVEARAFFWPAWRYQYSGWLHWELNIWSNNMSGDKRWPEVPWDPARGGIRNGEVGRIYPGPDATPLPSIRLENMRDGIEDYDYFWLLQDAVNKLDAADPERARLQKLIDETIVELSPSRGHFTRDPERVLQIHEQLGRELEKLLRAP